MRIAYYIWETFSSGGVQKITIDKVNYWAKYGHQVYLISTRQAGKPSFWEIHPDVVQIDLDIDFNTVNGIANPLKRLIALRYLHKRHREKLTEVLCKYPVDICVNTAFSTEAVAFPKLRDGSRKILESHGIKYALLPKFERKGWGINALLGRLQDYLRKKSYEALPHKYDHFVVLSPAHLEQWQGYANISAIPNMCTLSLDKPSSLTKKKAVIVARLAVEKNLFSLVRIWSKVVERAPDWILEIWGDGPLKEELQVQIDTLGLQGRVVLCGETKDISSVYLNASICCLSSNYEGFPMTLIEAQTAGLPIVSYNCPLGPRDIVHHGKDGFLIPLGDEDKYADVLLQLIDLQSFTPPPTHNPLCMGEKIRV